MLLHVRLLSVPFIILFVLLPTVAQPPQPKGEDKKFLSPLRPNTLPRTICSSLPRRELNGQCTSVANQDWGQARFAQFSYSGTDSRTPSGRGLLSARQISNIVFDQRADTCNSHGLNQLFVFFGQFIDHNFAATPQQEKERFDIPVPQPDGVLSDRILPFKRSMRGSADSGRRVRPINSLTSALDLAAVYAPNELRNSKLNEFDDGGSRTGRLKTSAGNLLPLNTEGFVNSPDTSERFFLAGDHRSNEHPVLTAIHTIFLREHNTLADQIARTIPSLPPSLVYDYARVLNVAQFQKIVFEEFYPAIVGRSLPPYKGFQKNVNPTISDIFIGAAFRIGHTMVGNEIPRSGPNGPLSSVRMADIFFRPARTFSSSELDNVIRGTANLRAQEVDSMVVDALRNFLFTKVSGEEGFDLVALNIQRGRDHALPKFNEIRSRFGIPKARSFSDISSNSATASKLRDAYRGNVDDVEAFVGLLAEDRVRGAGMGRTMIAVWDAEFTRLRDGDQFFGTFEKQFLKDVRPSLADWIRKVKTRGGITFRDIILRNSGIKSGQLPPGNIFKARQCRKGPSRPPPQRPTSPPQRPTSPPPRPTAPPTKPPGTRPICKKDVCCAGSCGECGGKGCSKRRGGALKCCTLDIQKRGLKCSQKIRDGCINQSISDSAPPICKKDVCCAGSCGECGGEGCSKRRGGALKCCTLDIQKRGLKCSQKIRDGCINQSIPDSAPPICKKGVCCAGSCGECGGEGCSKRRGGALKCCNSDIRERGIRCGGKTIDGCVE